MFQELEHNEVIYCATPLRNQFGIAFSVSKTAINIALETNSNDELIQMLKNFITIKRQANKDLSRYNFNDLYDTINKNIKTNNESDEISPLQ
ncbi:protein far1-related sequence 5-like [Gigaspora margarita]|uniref:Protein far1-related sequence 5-like n=1 Tax=Gigaspora margarita TaxID=4874 RepID=A0A8H4AGU6_GIGMA|nr:protein far1-related sequence 5-like [Gigaspora margarita]